MTEFVIICFGNSTNLDAVDFFVCVICESIIVSKAKEICEFCVDGGAVNVNG
ncbi:hypothetical protein [Nitrosopumilus sp.]|uniref:hypothetical protein n=1 Tax=Nitrosopumilus sp. TaxID=2024843 RepID=UPI0029314292|nr:hypothetical protein [Nitrosopumilus sp.]